MKKTAGCAAFVIAIACAFGSAGESGVGRLRRADLAERLAAACYALNAAQVVELVREGGDVNMVFHDGETPLTMATTLLFRDAGRRAECLEFIAFLLEQGADPTQKNQNGGNVVALTLDAHDAELWNLLLSRHPEKELFASLEWDFHSPETVAREGIEFTFVAPPGYVRFAGPGLEKFLAWMDLPETALASTFLFVPAETADAAPSDHKRIMAVTVFAGWKIPDTFMRDKHALLPRGLAGETFTWFFGKGFYSAGSPDSSRPWVDGDELAPFGSQLLILGMDRCVNRAVFLAALFDCGDGTGVSLGRYRDASRLLLGWCAALRAANE